jgi:hypothetical protein
MKLNFLQTLKSRTVWTVIALVLINGIPSVRDLLPEQSIPLVDMILGILAAYFRAVPSQGTATDTQSDTK